MQATMSIGDMTMVITEDRRTGGDTNHTILVYELDMAPEIQVVESEMEACACLADFLNPDEPSGKFADLFPSFCP